MKLSLAVIGKICRNIYKEGTQETYSDWEVAGFIEKLDLVSDGSVLVENNDKKDTIQST